MSALEYTRAIKAVTSFRFPSPDSRHVTKTTSEERNIIIVQFRKRRVL